MKTKIIIPQLPKFFKEEEQAKAVKFAEMLNELTGKAVYVNEFFMRTADTKSIFIRLWELETSTRNLMRQAIAKLRLSTSELQCIL